MSSCKNLRSQLPSSEKNKLPLSTELRREIQIALYSKLHDNFTGEPYTFVEIDRYIRWPVVRVCISTETREVVKLMESFINLYGMPEKIKSDRGSAFKSKDYIEFCKR